MDVEEIKEIILQDVDDNVLKILHELECNINHAHTNDIRSSLPNGRNTTKLRINKENLYCKIYDSDDDFQGDIFSLIMHFKNIDFVESIKFVCKAIGINSTSSTYSKRQKARSSFDEYFELFDGIEKEIKSDNIELDTFDESVLDLYEDACSLQFIRDGIGADVQKRYGLKFCLNENKTIVPWRNEKGEIIGLMGRQNMSAEKCKELKIAKWLPIKGYQFKKSKALYGMYENKSEILKMGFVLVAESEKSPMQASSMCLPKDISETPMALNNVVGIGGHELSQRQADILLSLRVPVILAYDNDIHDMFKSKQLELLKSKSQAFKIPHGFIINKENIKEEDKKKSPFDFEVDELMENIIFYFDEENQFKVQTLKEFIKKYYKREEDVKYVN